MSSIGITDPELIHEHCDKCIRLNCMYKTSCNLIYCPAGCNARFHSCKEEDHKVICVKEKVPCINKNNGCPREMSRGSIAKHLSVCPANVILCKHEWNRWPMHSHEEGWKAPMPFRNPRVRCGQFDVAFALRDQKVLMDSFKLPRKTRRVLRNPITWHYPAVPIQSHSSLMDSTSSDISQLSDDDTGTPWDLNCSPPGLQRTITNQLAAEKNLYEASKKATESLTQALDYVTGRAGLKRLAEITKKKDEEINVIKESENLESLTISDNCEPSCDSVKNDAAHTSKDEEEDEFDVYLNEKKLYQILGLDLSMHFISSYQAKPAKMYTFVCGQEFRRDEFAWHVKNIHSDIQANLNHWFEQRCPLSYAGCTFSFQRFKPKIPTGAVIHSPILHSFGLALEEEFTIDTDHTSGKLTDDEDIRTTFGRNRLREATPEIHTSYKCDSSVTVIPRYKSVSRETSPVKHGHSFEEQLFSLTDLPFEVLQNITRRLDSFSIKHLSMTCNLLQNVCCSLLDECGVVSLVWQKTNPERSTDASPMWNVAYKCWRFSVGATPVHTWRFREDCVSAMSKHLAVCDYNQSCVRNIAAEPARLVYSVEECEGITRQQLMEKKRAARKIQTITNCW